MTKDQIGIKRYFYHMKVFYTGLMCVLTCVTSFSQAVGIPADEGSILTGGGLSLATHAALHGGKEAFKPVKLDAMADILVGFDSTGYVPDARTRSAAEGSESRGVMVGATGQMFGLSGRLVKFENPGFSVLIPFPADCNSRKDLTIAVGMFHHEKVTNSVYLGINRTFKSFKHGEQLMLDLSWGCGYMHSWYPGELYLQTTEGDLVQKRQIGRPHLYGSAGLLGKWAFGEAVALTWRQQVLLQTPFANGIPVMLHRLMTIGVQFQFHQNR